MKARLFKYFLVCVAMMAFVATVSAQSSANGREIWGAESLADSVKILPSSSASFDSHYIVILEDAPLASFRGGTRDLSATSPSVTGDARLNVNSDASQAYLAHLEQAQVAVLDAIEATIGESPNVRMRYQIATNGFSVELTPAQVKAVSQIDGIARIYPNFVRQLQTDVGPQWIGADTIWSGASTPSGTGTQGEGMVVGILDTGVNTDHPSFADIGGDGYDHPAPAGGFVGWCNPTHPSYDASIVCNDKLIGVYSYPSAGDDPEDDDGHGSHTGSTTAGNVVLGATILGPTTSITSDISGVAPHAHIIAYDVCAGQGCPGDAILGGIDDATADGVDVINYSIGGGEADPWAQADDLAFLAANDANVMVVTSAGNSGPGPETIGSPASAPWLFSVGASTHNRNITNSLTGLTSDGDSLSDIIAAGFTSGYGPAPIVYAGDFPNANDPSGDPAQCLEPYPAGTFSGEIVVCDRGAIARVAKGQNVLAGGAGGFVLANTDASGESIVADAHFLPGVHIGDAAGDILRDWLANNTGTMATISGFTVDYAASNGDIMAGFSSRGPLVTSEVFKPDITAPGVSVWAAIENDTDAATDEYGFNSGTSMSSPHVAGAATLIRAVHPSWTPAQVKSAIMLTANQSQVLKEDGATDADPFDMGSGRADLTMAAQTGLVLDETITGFEDANPANGGVPNALNIASMQENNCIGSCTWVRTVANPTSQTINWTGAIVGGTGTVTPAAFTLAPGESQELTVVIDSSGATLDQWHFAELQLTGDGTTADAHMPIAYMPTGGEFTDIVEIYTRRNAGTAYEPGVGLEITDFASEVFGLVPAQFVNISLDVDPSNGDAYDNLDDVFYATVTVPAGAARLVAEITASTAPDIDLFWGLDSDGDGLPSAAEQLGASATATALEYLNASQPAAGTYWVLVQNWAGSGATDDVTLSLGLVMGDEGNMTISGPDTNPAGTPFTVGINWDEASLVNGDIWYGAFSIGTAAATPSNIAAYVPVDLHFLGDDVEKSVSATVAGVGDTLSYTITVNPNDWNDGDVEYNVTDALPTGLSLVAGSASASAGTVTESGNTVSWTGTMSGPTDNSRYIITSSADDSSCNTPFGGYADMESLYSVATIAGLAGDSISWQFTTLGAGADFFGSAISAAPRFTDDGFALFEPSEPADVGAEPWVNQSLPDSVAPNGLLAAYWRDMEIFYDAASNQGVSGVTFNGGDLWVVEFDDVRPWQSSDSLDFEIIQWKANDPTEGTVDMWVAFDNVNISDTVGTVGIENSDGTAGTQMYYDDFTPTDGLIICYDWVEEALPAGDPVTITFDAVVTEEACAPFPPAPLVNVATSTTDAAGFEAATEASAEAVAINACSPTDVSLTNVDGGAAASLLPALVAVMVAGVALLAVRKRRDEVA